MGLNFRKEYIGHMLKLFPCGKEREINWLYVKTSSGEGAKA